MPRLRTLVLLLAFVGVVSVWSPAGALANGCNGSAGDNQYVDPLQNCNPAGAGSSGGSHGSTTSTPATPTTTPATSPTTSASTDVTSTTATTTSTASGVAKDPSSSKTLPFTGLDLGPALIVAATLLGGGLLLRRVAGQIR